jgi:hypothetical protein
MIRFLFRTLGLLFLAAAFVSFVYDGTVSIAANAVMFTGLAELWTRVHAASLLRAQAIIERSAPAWVWDAIALPILNAPAFLVFGVVGVILMLIGRPKKPLIGYSR